MPTLIRCVLGADSLPSFVEGMTNLVVGMTVWETREHSPETQQIVSYRGVPYAIAGLSVNIDIVSDDSWVDDIIQRIRDAHVRNEFSVRHLYVSPVEVSYHIRNGFIDI